MKCKPVKEHYPTFRQNCITQIGNWRHNSSLGTDQKLTNNYAEVEKIFLL